MEDIYDDLDNFEQENVEELKNENKELKCKLLEYASTLDKLQKDFDKLSSEYKKLELNYSSLLKTARAEIERKSKIITTLNLEKDQLVLNALQNKGRVHPVHQNKMGSRSNSQSMENQAVKSDNSDKGKKEVNMYSQIENTVTFTVNNDRIDKLDRTTRSKTKFSDASLKVDSEAKEKDLKQKSSNHNSDKDRTKPDDKSNKERVLHKFANEKLNVKKIVNRRKSMPLLNRNDIKWSSDEEQEENPRDHRFRRKTPSRDFGDRKRHNDRNSRNVPKLPDCTRVEDKYASYHDSSRDNYRKSNNWCHDNERYRSKDNRDKYEPSQRSRRHSPDKSRYNTHNTHKEYTNDRSHRSDTLRHRVLESPPPDKFNQFRRSRDIDSRNRFHNDEVYAMKHKLHNVVDPQEPVRKRSRTDSLSKQSNEHVNLHQDIGIYPPQPVEFSYLSLQSPDYISLENNSGHQIKEIMGTAATALDDPRLKSNKYVLKTHKDKVVLSTVTGRDMDIKCVDKSIWGNEKDAGIGKMPTPLKERPQISEDLVKEICMDIEHPILNLSLESGEIGYSEDDTGIANENTGIVKLKAATSIANANVHCNKTAHDNVQSQDQMEANIKQTVVPVPEIHKSPESFFKKYTIPKIKNTTTNRPLKNVITNKTHKLDKKDHSNQCQKKKIEVEKREIRKSIQKEFDIHNPLKLFSSARRASGDKTKDQVIDLHQEKYSSQKASSSARDTVEGDLELSDETSDYTDLTDQTRYNNDKNALSLECTKKLPNDDTDTAHTHEKKTADSISSRHGDLKYGTETLCDKNNTKHINHTEVRPKEILSIPNKETKPIDIKTKLCDLFGDSSSLITPDDLGITQPSASNQISDFAPLFDNTQDAIDFNVEDMEKVKTRSSKTKAEKTAVNTAHQDAKPDKKHKHKGSKLNNEGKKKHKINTEKASVNDKEIEKIENKNPRVLIDEPNVIKTVIISTGIQNDCNSIGVVFDEGQPKVSSRIQDNNINDLPTSQVMPCLKALATSTPHKVTQNEPTVSVPDISSNHKSVGTIDVGKSSTQPGNTTKSDLDVPDVRIFIKRRRKGKVAPT